MNKKGFSRLEMLVVIVVGLVTILGGILIAINLSTKADVERLKEAAGIVASDGKNAYLSLVKEDKIDYILPGEYSSMCITINGLIKNGFLTDDYEKYEGYVVVEYKDDKYISSVWMTDKKYLINGYAEDKISDLKYENGVIDFDESIKMKQTSSYSSASKDNGGTSNSYSNTCINEKIDKKQEEQPVENNEENNEEQNQETINE